MHIQWIFEQQGCQWVIRSAGSGAYLGVEGSPEDGKPVVALEYPYAFDIWPDEHDNSVYRSVDSVQRISWLNA